MFHPSILPRDSRKLRFTTSLQLPCSACSASQSQRSSTAESAPAAETLPTEATGATVCEGGVLRKSWGDPQDPWEIYEESMENMGNLWKIYGKYIYISKIL